MSNKEWVPRLVVQKECAHAWNNDALYPDRPVHLDVQLLGGDDLGAKLVESQIAVIKSIVDEARELPSSGIPRFAMRCHHGEGDASATSKLLACRQELKMFQGDESDVEAFRMTVITVVVHKTLNMTVIIARLFQQCASCPDLYYSL